MEYLLRIFNFLEQYIGRVANFLVIARCKNVKKRYGRDIIKTIWIIIRRLASNLELENMKVPFLGVSSLPI